MQQRHLTSKTTRAPIAQELTKTAKECEVPTTCNESHLPYLDEGAQNCSRKLADMMIVCNCCITPNLILNVHKATHTVTE